MGWDSFTPLPSQTLARRGADVAVRMIRTRDNVNAVLERLAHGAMVPAPPAALLPDEACHVRHAAASTNVRTEAMPACSTINWRAINWSTLDVAGHLGAIQGCWFAGVPRACGMYRTHQFDVSDRLLMRYPLDKGGVIPANVASSHLLAMLRLLQRRTNSSNAVPSIFFFGDSTMVSIAQAARCEVVRSTLSQREALLASNNPEALGKVLKEAARAASGIRVEKLGPSRRLATQLQRICSEVRRSGGILVASMGVHYNNVGEMRTDGGIVEAKGAYTRHDHQRDLKTLLPALGQLGEHCAANGTSNACIAVYMTATAQHFPSAYGNFDPVAGNHSLLAPGSYGCQDFLARGNATARTTHPTAPGTHPRPGPRHHGLTSWHDSPNYWRPAEAIEGLRRLAPHVALVPAHLLSRGWWDAHAGTSALTWRGEAKPGSKVLFDCTHFCYSPFLYEPIWWALSQIHAQNLLQK